MLTREDLDTEEKEENGRQEHFTFGFLKTQHSFQCTLYLG